MSATRTLPRVTYALAERHEALWLRLKALIDQVAATAHRHPHKPVTAQTRNVAEAILGEARVFLPRGTRERLPPAAPDWGGLLTQLGQVLAQMEAYEAQNTGWDQASGARVWRSAHDTFPVRRLAPRIVVKHPSVSAPRQPDITKELGKMMKGRFHAEYQRGFEDGQKAARTERLRTEQAEQDRLDEEMEADLLFRRTYPRIRGLD